MGVGWNQTFAFEKAKLSKVHRFLEENEGLTIGQCSEQLPFGGNAVEGHIQYLKHFGVYDTQRRTLTPLGRTIAAHDPGWRARGTSLLLQMEVAGNEDATVWHHVINTMLPKYSRFSKDEARVEMEQADWYGDVSQSNARRDLNTCLRSLTERTALGEVGVLKKTSLGDKEWYRRSTPDAIPPMILACALYRQRERHFPQDRSVELGRLLGQEGGVGRAFNLRAESFLDLIRPLEQQDVVGYASTAQLNDIEFLNPPDDPFTFASAYYEGSAPA